jgi:hypothetical protein
MSDHTEVTDEEMEREFLELLAGMTPEQKQEVYRKMISLAAACGLPALDPGQS